MVVKGKVLKEVGFPTNSLVEDFKFADELIRRGYKTWQSKTRVSIKSPNCIKDFWRQRARWFKGIFLELPNTNPVTFLFVSMRALGGIFSNLIWLPLWLMFPPSTPLALLGFVGALYYLSSYVYGIYSSKKLKYVLLLPILGVFEAISILFIIKTKSFTVIDKN